jgi:hypothetical protein
MLGHMPEYSGDQRMVTHDSKGYSNHRFMEIDLYVSETVKIYMSHSEMN